MEHYNSIPKDANANMKCIRHNDFLANVVICNFSKIFVSLLYDEKTRYLQRKCNILAVE